MRVRKLKDAVVVITGASSGIGRASALAFAREGASLVLVARSGEPLAGVVEACGGPKKAIAVVADVANESSVYGIAARAVAAFGRIDVWVNNAAVSVYGLFEHVPSEVWRRVVETDLLGYVHGARAAIAEFRRSGGGVLVNVGSMLSAVPQPFATAYVAAKHAVRGFSSSLRQEMLLTAPDIAVSTVMPAAIDTPYFQHAANYAGRKLIPPSPIYPPERVARAIVRMALRPKAEVFVGSSARIANALSLLAPRGFERFFARFADHGHFEKTPVPPSAGNVFAPKPPEALSGGWKSRGVRRLARNALIASVLLAPLALAGRAQARA